MRLSNLLTWTAGGVLLAANLATASEGNPPAGKIETSSTQTELGTGAAAVTGLTAELTGALATTAKLSGTERDDRAALAKFYEARQYEPAWIGASAVSPAGKAVIAELAKAGDWGLDASAFRLPPMPAGSTELSRAERARLDVAVSLTVLKYARHARGSRVDPNTLSKFIDRKLPLADPARVIDAVAKADAPDAALRGLHPQHAQFERLRQKWLAMKSGQAVAKSEPAADAKASPKKAAAPQTASAQRLLVNMEQWRWMPEQLGDVYVWVNVPEFLIRVVRGGKVVHTERVVVGKNETQTPVFSDEMEQIIFHPFWGIPDSIKQADILPTLLRSNTRMIERYNLRIQSGGKDIEWLSVDWTQNDIRKFHVYQPPGDTNLLGAVKFRFPNKHDVYMHDTPQKKLFEAQVRAFSHGCMRVRDPQKLAEVLLADEGWPAQRVAAAMAVGGAPNNHVNLKRRIAVHITYFTAAVDDDGKLKLFGDIYDHESKVALALDGKAHLIPRWKVDKKPIDVVGSLSEAYRPIERKDWKQRIFDN